MYRRLVCPSQQASNTVDQGTADNAQAAVGGRRKWHIDEIYDVYSSAYHYATNRQVAGLIPDGVIEIFQ